MSCYTKKATLEVDVTKTKCDGCGMDQLSDAEAFQAAHTGLGGSYRLYEGKPYFVSVQVPNPKFVPEERPSYDANGADVEEDRPVYLTPKQYHAMAGCIREEPVKLERETRYITRDFCAKCAQGRFL